MSFATARAAVVTWTGAGDGTSWSDPLNWSTSALPGPGDNVTIGPVAGNPTIQITGTLNLVQIRSLTSSEPINISSGTIEVSTTIQTSQALTLSGGAIESGTITSSGSAAITVSSGTLDGVTLESNLAVSGSLAVLNGLTLRHANLIIGGTSSSASVYFQGTQTLSGTGTAVFAGITGQNYLDAQGGGTQGTAATLTIGSGITVDGSEGGYIEGLYSFDSIINQGAINANASAANGMTSSAQKIFVTNFGNDTVGEYNATTGAVINASLLGSGYLPGGIAISGNNLFVANYGVDGDSTVGEYNATTGAVINASLVSGLSSIAGIAISGNNLFVADDYNDTVGEYNATTGAVINASLLGSGYLPAGIAISGNNLFVANYGDGTVGEYNATTGAVINASLVSGLGYPNGIAISGNNLFVANTDNGGFDDYDGSIGEYNATTGAVINASLVSAYGYDPAGIAISGNNLFVANYGDGTVGEYNATTGAVINASLVSGLGDLGGIAISSAGQTVITISGSSVTNEGTMEASNGGSLTTTNLVNANGLSVSDGGTLTLSGTWTNTGTISQTNSTVNLGGSFTLADVGTFNSTGGIVNITGVLNNMDATLALSGTTGTWNLLGGTILGGTVTTLAARHLPRHPAR